MAGPQVAPQVTGGSVEVTGPELLSRTVFYKVGHHGSHNATATDIGSEQMTSEDPGAFIPVFKEQAVKNRWMNMPFAPLVNRSRRRPGGACCSPMERSRPSGSCRGCRVPPASASWHPCKRHPRGLYSNAVLTDPTPAKAQPVSSDQRIFDGSLIVSPATMKAPRPRDAAYAGPCRPGRSRP